MRSYIVRIYRDGRRRQLVGVVEKVGGKDKRVFTDRDELWGILYGLARRPVPARPRAHAAKRQPGAASVRG